ncbi:MAG: sulfatase/phosphatase domain-containing protein, partial [Planctomycetota bacterium]
IGIPMIIRWPGKIEPGTIVDDLVSTIDVAPTSLWAAGIDPPRHLQGHPFMGPDRRTRRYVFAARDRCGETVDRVRCVRSHQYKYIRNYDPDRPYTQFTGYKKLQYPVLTLMDVLHRHGKLTPEHARFMATARPAEELYDLREDPFELHNLADDPNCEKALKQHRRKLDEWVKTTEDQGETPEPDGVRDYWRGNAKGYFERGMKSRGLATDISDEDYLRWWEQKLLD